MVFYYIHPTISHFRGVFTQISCLLFRAQSQFKPCSISSCKSGSQLAGHIHAFNNYRAAIALNRFLRDCFFAAHTFTCLTDCRIAVARCRHNVNSLLLCILKIFSYRNRCSYGTSVYIPLVLLIWILFSIFRFQR